MCSLRVSPVWNETFELFVRKKELETIQIVVKDEDKYSKHDDLGSTEISLKSLTNEVTDSWYPLSNCKSGQLHLKLSFLPLSPTDTPPCLCVYCFFVPIIIHSQTKEHYSTD
jgi:hypothetical protein